MRGRGGGQRGRGGSSGRRTAKKGQDNYDWRSDQGIETETKAPIPGGFKSMKSRWLKTFEQEQREKEEAQRAAKLASEQQAALQTEVVTDALKDGPSTSRPTTDGREPCTAEGSGPDAQPLQTKQSAQSYERNPDPVPSSAPDPGLPTAVSASDPTAAAQQELALEAEANAIAELADSASEGERELGTSGLADVVVDSPPARRAPEGRRHGSSGGPPIPDFAQKALSEVQAGQISHSSKHKKAADHAQAVDQPPKRMVQKQAIPALDSVSDTRYQGAKASSREHDDADRAAQAGPGSEQDNRPAQGDSNAAAATEAAGHSGRKREGGEQQLQAPRKRPKHNAAVTREITQQGQHPPDTKHAADTAAAKGQVPAVKEEGQAVEGSEGLRGTGTEGSEGVLAAVEYLGDGCTHGQQLGEVNLAKYDSYMSLWNGLRQAYGKSLPETTGLKVVYQDSDGDFILLRPDEPWVHFLSNARRVIISCR